MSSAAAAILDELMGRDRDLLPDEKPTGPNWDDDRVCRYFLCGFCPHDMFTNTKSDLGQCPKKHDQKLREKYEESSQFKKCGYEDQFLKYLEGLVDDMDRKIKRGCQRLATNTAYREKIASDEGNDAAGNEDIARIEETVDSLLKEVEELGQQGEVEEAQRIMRKIDRLKREKEERQFSGHRAELDDYEKRMEVCNTCGAFLVINDSQIRLDAHLQGKQHIGFTKVRARIEELKKMRSAQDEAQGSRERERRRSSYHDQDADTDRDRDRNRDRDRDRDRDRHRDRESGREREHRDRDYDRSRDRDRDGERRRYRSDSDRRRDDHSRTQERRGH